MPAVFQAEDGMWYRVTSIGDNAFDECMGLASVDIPDSVTSIGKYAFYMCRDLNAITLSDRLTSIGVKAFYDCSELTSIVIPTSVTRIDWCAFASCLGLTTIYYNGSMTGWTAIEKDSAWDQHTGDYTIIYGAVDIPQDQWTVSGHCAQIVGKEGHLNSAMVAAGGVESGALLHQGAIYVGELDLSKFSKVIIFNGTDNSSVTQNHYNYNANNRFILSKVDNKTNSPAEADIIASATYTLHGWAVEPFVIDLTDIDYNGPVYVTWDTLPGTFMLVSEIVFVYDEEISKPEPEIPEEPEIPVGESYNVPQDQWTVSGHCAQIVGKEGHPNSGMVAVGGVESAALLHQGAIYVGELDLSKFSKVIIYNGTDASPDTQYHYNYNANNRFILSKVDTEWTMSPAEKDIIASATYSLHGWAVEPFVIDLTDIDYNGPVYVTWDTLPGTFMLVSEIVFVYE